MPPIIESGLAAKAAKLAAWLSDPANQLQEHKAPAEIPGPFLVPDQEPGGLSSFSA
jgi:hypothetical protein